MTCFLSYSDDLSDTILCNCDCKGDLAEHVSVILCKNDVPDIYASIVCEVDIAYTFAAIH